MTQEQALKAAKDLFEFGGEVSETIYDEEKGGLLKTSYQIHMMPPHFLTKEDLISQTTRLEEEKVKVSELAALIPEKEVVEEKPA